jgi:hypothetical protein
VVDCPAAGGNVEVNGYQGFLICPPYAELCGLEIAAEAARTSLLDASALRLKGVISHGRCGYFHVPPFGLHGESLMKYTGAHENYLAHPWLGVIPLSGKAGTIIRITIRGLDSSTSAYIGGVPTDTCSASVALTGDAATNEVACEAAGG